MIAKAFDPATAEAKIYANWIEKGFFKGQDSSQNSPFSIVIPPP